MISIIFFEATSISLSQLSVMTSITEPPTNHLFRSASMSGHSQRVRLKVYLAAILLILNYTEVVIESSAPFLWWCPSIFFLSVFIVFI